MKVILLAETGELLDEAMRNTAHYIHNELSNYCEVKLMDMRKWGRKEFWIQLKEFNPNIVHYLHGPTISTFMFLKLLRSYLPKTKIIVSAPRPVIPAPVRPLLHYLKPDLVLAQSNLTYNLFQSANINVKLFPVGVDINRFHQVNDDKKIELRMKYNIPLDKFLILHIGSIKLGRNTHLLGDLNTEENQVLVVGRVTTNNDREIYKTLVSKGCIVWLKYFKNVEELYQMADCYVYPAVHKFDRWGRNITDSIEMPLTVLEAMATNIKVVTTRFGGLPIFFKEGDGLVYVDDPTPKNLLEKIEKRKKDSNIETRKKVSSFSWDNIAKMLLEVYEDVLKER